MTKPFKFRLFGFIGGGELPFEVRETLYEEITDASWPHRRFYILVALSSVIAAYGLLSNSAAVIIGAMLVAPLMGPIFGIALALVAGDRHLLRAALSAEVIGVALSIALAVAIGILPFNLGTTSEMLARTTPTLYDLAIAFASGFAGAYASVQPRINAALPGVAIAVALVPPLASCGLLAARGHWELSWGALMLFFANFFAIQLAAAAVFAIYKMGEVHVEGSSSIRNICWRFLPSALAVIAIGFFMFSTLVRLMNERTFQKTLTAVLAREISYVTGGHLDQIISQRQTDVGYEIIATALTPYPFEPANVGKIQEALRNEVRPDLYLIIRSLQSKDANAQGQVFLSPEDLEVRRESELNAQILSSARASVERDIRSIGGARLDNLFRTSDPGGLRFTAVISTPKLISPETVGQIEANLQSEIGQPARLIVRSIIARDADRDHFIYDAVPDKAPELPPEEAQLRADIRGELAAQLAEFEGATLIDVHFMVFDGELEITAVVETPYPILPDDVERLHTALNEKIGRDAKLFVNSVMGGTAGADGWLTDPSRKPPAPHETAIQETGG